MKRSIDEAGPSGESRPKRLRIDPPRMSASSPSQPCTGVNVGGHSVFFPIGQIGGALNNVNLSPPPTTTRPVDRRDGPGKFVHVYNFCIFTITYCPNLYLTSKYYSRVILLSCQMAP